MQLRDPKMHNHFCLAGYITLTEDWHPYYPKYFKFVIFFLLCWTKNIIQQKNMTSFLEKENLQADSFIQNNCIITKAAESMSENNWCDRLWHIDWVPEQVKQRFASPCVPQLQEIFLLISLCHGFDRDGKNVQTYNILLN